MSAILYDMRIVHDVCRERGASTDDSDGGFYLPCRAIPLQYAA